MTATLNNAQWCHALGQSGPASRASCSALSTCASSVAACQRPSQGRVACRGVVASWHALREGETWLYQSERARHGSTGGGRECATGSRPGSSRLLHPASLPCCACQSREWFIPRQRFINHTTHTTHRANGGLVQALPQSPLPDAQPQVGPGSHRRLGPLHPLVAGVECRAT
jgi:hypothetical protein